VDVDGARPAVVLVAPHPRQERFAGEDLARVLREELEQLVLHVGEVERSGVDGRLVRLQVERKGAVLDHVRSDAATFPPEQVAEPSLELDRVERREAEVVEQLAAQLEVGQLPAGDEDEQRRHRAVALAQHTGDGPGAFRVGVGCDHRPRPSLARLVARRAVGVADRLPPVAGEVERAGEVGRRRIGEDSEEVHRIAHKDRR